MTRTGRQLRISATSTKSGLVTITLRKAGRVIGTARRSVHAGHRFTLTIAARHRLRPGRYTLTTTLRPTNGRAWTNSEPIQVR